MILHFAIIAFLSPVILGLGQPEDCFLPGECLSSVHIDGGTAGKCKNEFTVVQVGLFS